MTILPNYTHFASANWDTGTVANVLAYAGQPIDEALIFGIGGGIVAGYFTFDFHGADPQLTFLARYSFDPLKVIYGRLGIKPIVRQTDQPERARRYLLEALDAGQPAIVLADLYSLSYNNLSADPLEWAMMPVLVYGHDDHQAHLADRARVGLTVPADELAAARGRVKKDKHRLWTLPPADLDRLPAAVEQGIRACLNSFYGDPPLAPLKNKFGFAAYQKWADLLVNRKDKLAWSKYFAAGPRFYNGLTSAYRGIELLGTGGAASRPQYADFLEQAAALLDRPALKAAAAPFRAAAARWGELTAALLPESVPLLAETRRLMQREGQLFVEQGGASLAERQQLSARRESLRRQWNDGAALDEAETAALCESLRERVLAVHAAEQTALAALRDALG